MKKIFMSLTLVMGFGIGRAHAYNYEFMIREDGRSWCELHCDVGGRYGIASQPDVGFEIENQHHCDILGRDLCEKKSGFNATEAGKKLRNQ